jgi:hypothetical protein
VSDLALASPTYPLRGEQVVDSDPDGEPKRANEVPNEDIAWPVLALEDT